MSDCFLSIVHKHCNENELLVRARRKGDIQKVFPNATVNEYPEHDYLYAAIVPRHFVAKAIAREVVEINYPAFKSTVTDPDLHDAYMQVWSTMAGLQS